MVLLFAAINLIGAADAPFSADDEFSTVSAICGNVTQGTAIRGISGTDETVNGYISENGYTFYEVLLSSSFLEHGALRHMIVIGGHYLEDGKIRDTEAERTEVSFGLLEFQRKEWKIIAKAPDFIETGFNGNNPGSALREIGESRHGIELTQDQWFQGSSLTIVSLYEPVRSNFKELFSVMVAADDCALKKGCFKYEGKLVYLSDSNRSPKDVALHLKGTYRNTAGRVVPVPSSPIVLSFKEGFYGPLDASAAGASLWRAVTQSPW